MAFTNSVKGYNLTHSSQQLGDCKYFLMVKKCNQHSQQLVRFVESKCGGWVSFSPQSAESI